MHKVAFENTVAEVLRKLQHKQEDKSNVANITIDSSAQLQGNRLMNGQKP